MIYIRLGPCCALAKNTPYVALAVEHANDHDVLVLLAPHIEPLLSKCAQLSHSRECVEQLCFNTFRHFSALRTAAYTIAT